MSSAAQRHWQRAETLAHRGDWARAAHALHRAERLEPEAPLFPLHRARALLHAGHPGEALHAARRAHRLDSAEPLALWLQAHALDRLQRYDEVATLLLPLPPAQRHDHALHRMLAFALLHTGRHREAIPAFLDALALRLDDAPAHYQLGLCFRALDMRREATECFRTALALGPNTVEHCARALLAFDLRGLCLWDDAEAHLRSLRHTALAWPADSALRSEPFVHATLLDDPQAQLAAASACARAMSAAVTMLPPRAPTPRERLRIGYVSSDFRAHATMHLMIEVLEQHDRERFEVTLYSHALDDGSAMRRRVEAACERFADVRTLGDDALAQRIRADGIDILVDLKGYTHDNRFEVFARRAAPLQATWLGYPGTTGAPFIDYVIGDAVVTPIDDAAYYREKIAQLPGCYQPNDRRRARPEVAPRADCALSEHALVFACFNQPYKISPQVFDVWCALLHELPDAVLWLIEAGPTERAALEEQAASRRIESARLVWAPRLGASEHLTRLRNADLFLDTWPCNAHTTASDALWVGVPVVTVVGSTFASRVAASLLHAVGLPELACASIDRYVRTVLALAHDPARRSQLRAHLDRARDEAPLFDSRQRTRDLERLYERMWAACVAGAPPDHLAAPPVGT